MFGFGKKKEEFEDIEKELGLPEEIGKVPEPPKEEMPDLPEESARPENPAYKEHDFEVKEVPKQEEHHMPTKDLELISAKLDSIRLMIDGMNERVKHIERMEENEAKKRRAW